MIIVHEGGEAGSDLATVVTTPRSRHDAALVSSLSATLDQGVGVDARLSLPASTFEFVPPSRVLQHHIASRPRSIHCMRISLRKIPVDVVEESLATIFNIGIGVLATAFRLWSATGF